MQFGTPNELAEPSRDVPTIDGPEQTGSAGGVGEVQVVSAYVGSAE